jgi:large subunit ribosomal protein L10
LSEARSSLPACARAFFWGDHVKKEQKAQVIEEIAAQIDAAGAVYAVDYRGLSVTQAAQLRSSLRDAGASFRIVKNTLTLRAADKVGAEDLKSLVEEGPTALTFVQGDPALAAKTLDSFARQNQILDFKGGILGPDVLTADQVRQIARLPGRDLLNAQIAGVVASPITGLVRGLGSMLGGLAIALGQVASGRADEVPETAPDQATAEEVSASAAEEASEAPAAEEAPEEGPTAEAGAEPEASEQSESPASGEEAESKEA